MIHQIWRSVPHKEYSCHVITGVGEGVGKFRPVQIDRGFQMLPEPVQKINVRENFTSAGATVASMISFPWFFFLLFFLEVLGFFLPCSDFFPPEGLSESS